MKYSTLPFTFTAKCPFLSCNCTHNTRAAKSHALSVRVTQFHLQSRTTPHLAFPRIFAVLALRRLRSCLDLPTSNIPNYAAVGLGWGAAPKAKGGADGRARHFLLPTSVISSSSPHRPVVGPLVVFLAAAAATQLL